MVTHIALVSLYVQHICDNAMDDVRSHVITRDVYHVTCTLYVCFNPTWCRCNNMTYYIPVIGSFGVTVGDNQRTF